MFRLGIAAISLAGSLLLVESVQAQDPVKRGLDGLKEIPLSQLKDPHISPLGQAALAIQPAGWKHAETENFAYHFFHGHVATAVAVEAEFYYRFLAKELDRDTTQWERKGHIYIFERPSQWQEFQTKAALDPWTGGIHSGGDLFLLRDTDFKFKGSTLGHEITHLVLHRFFGPGIPLWLNEGYAEYASSRGYSSFMRSRNYASKPHSQAISPTEFIPLAQLTSFLHYPTDQKQIATFYNQSEKLVRFLCSVKKKTSPCFSTASPKATGWKPRW